MSFVADVLSDSSGYRTTYQIGLAMILLFVVTSLQGIGAVFNDTRAWTGLIFGLGLCGTGLAYVIYYYIVENLGAVAASGVTYVPPVVALVIGIILSGVALLQYGSRRASVSKRIGKDLFVRFSPLRY